MTLKEEIGRVAVDILRAALRGGMISAASHPATHRVALLTLKLWDTNEELAMLRAAEDAQRVIRVAQGANGASGQ